MNRRWPALAAVAALALLAGCPQAATIDLSPDVSDAERLANGDYRVTLSVDLAERGTHERLADARVDGYGLFGERVCTAEFGEVSGSESTRTVRCEQFPALLISDTADRGDAVPSDNWNGRDSFTVQAHAALYVGQRDHEHSFERITSLSDGLAREQFLNRSGRVVPTAPALQTWQCQQWKRQERGADFSALHDAEWLDWTQRPPNTTSVYEATVWNYTRLEEHNRTDQVVEGKPTPYSLDEVPAWIERSSSPRIGRVRTVELNRSTFDATVHRLSGQRVTATAELSAALDRIRGSSGAYDNVAINCRASPPRYHENQGGYNYDRGQWVTFLVTDGELTWAIDLRTREEVAGPAFVNVTELPPGPATPRSSP